MSLIEEFSEFKTANEFQRVKGSRSYNALLDDLEKKFDQARRDRLPFEREWYTNLAFYFGRQYVRWVSTGDINFAQLRDTDAPPWRVRLVVNKIKKIARTEIAKLTQEHPRGFIIPASSDDADLAASKAGEKVLDYLYTEMSHRKLILRAAFWQVLTGNGFIRDGWDESKRGNTVGGLTLDVVTPFHLFVSDVSTEEIEDQAFVVYATGKAADWTKQTYGHTPTPVGNQSKPEHEDKFLRSLGIRSQSHNKVYIKEIWIKPNPQYPNGAQIVWADKDILWQNTDGWPFSHDEYPFSHLSNIPTGKFYGSSIIPDLIPLQKEYNRGRSQIIENKNRMARPQLAAPRGSIDSSKLTSEPGLIIFYQPGFKEPTPIPLQPLPNYVIQDLAMTDNDMQDLASQHQTGETPSNVEAASAISFLQERDDLTLQPAVSSLELAVQKVNRHCLQIVKDYWEEERLIRVAGQNNSFEAFYFKGADLRSNVDYIVETGSATPTTRAAKQAFIMELGKMGWIQPQQALKYLQYGDSSRLNEELMLDTRHAQRENLKIMSGNPVPINTWDNDLIHITEHDAFRKTQQFETAGEEVQVAIDQHVLLHKLRLALKMGHPMEMPQDDQQKMQVEGMLSLILAPLLEGLPAMGMGGSNEEEGGEGAVQPG